MTGRMSYTRESAAVRRSRWSRVCRGAVFAIAGLALGGVGVSPGVEARDSEPPARWQDGDDLSRLIGRFQADEESVGRFYSMQWSAARLDRLDSLYAEYAESLKRVDFASLPREAQIDVLMLRTSLEARRGNLALQRRRLAEMDAILPLRESLQGLELGRRRMEPIDARAAADLLSKVPGAVAEAKARVEASRREEGGVRVTPVAAQRAAGVIGELRRGLQTWFEFADGFVPEFGWWVRKPREEADRALAEYAKYLREDIAGVRGRPEDPLIGDPIGREALLSDLRGEMIASTPEELIALGEREFAWCEAEAKKASAALGFGDDWRAALERVKQSHVPPGEQAAFVRDCARAAIALLKEKDLITIPPLSDETWRLEMHSPETQRFLPFAVYGGQYMGVSYPTDAMPHGDKLMSMRGNNRHFTHIVTPHELIPGHHLQRFISDRSRPHRGIFFTPFYVEGWALYWEFRLWDLGWAGRTGQDPNMDRLGMLFWRMHRCARIIVSLKFHLGQMTPAEMIDFLVDRVGHERMGATSEVRRYIAGDYSPLYQAGYMLGGLQIHALYRELVPTGRMTDREFNDAVLGFGMGPIAMLRASLMPEVRLTPDWQPPATPIPPTPTPTPTPAR